jgi:hypothetical protein
MRKPINEGELEWIGTIVTTPNGQPPTNPFTFEAVIPRILDARMGTYILRIHSVQNWKMRTERDQGWTALHRKDDVLAFQTTNAGAMPVRVLLTALPPSSPAGSSVPLPLSPLPRSVSGREAALPLSAIIETPPGFTPAGTTTMPASPGISPLAALLGWSLAIAILSLLLVRFPRTTWPEQLGLILVLFGATIIGHWWIGVAGWIVARFLSLLETVRYSSGGKPQSNSTQPEKIVSG